jgi:hypothetical protein
VLTDRHQAQASVKQRATHDHAAREYENRHFVPFFRAALVALSMMSE